MVNTVPLTHLPAGEKAIVRSITGGFGLIRRLDALGIREGKEIVKISASFARGPVILRCGGMEAAIGFGMAQKILVEVLSGGGIS